MYTVEPYDLRFSSNIEFEIPFKELNNEENNVDIIQFQPRNGIYLKLPTEIDKYTRTVKFRSDTAGVFVFVEKPSSVSHLINIYEVKCVFFCEIYLATMDRWCRYTSCITNHCCNFNYSLLAIKSKQVFQN